MTHTTSREVDQHLMGGVPNHRHSKTMSISSPLVAKARLSRDSASSIEFINSRFPPQAPSTGRRQAQGAGGGVTTGPLLPLRCMREAEIGTLHVVAEQNAGEAWELAGVVPF
jgi:hypothetical protein